ncbi:MAG TPA: redoxin domain-containing protein [Pyrinomonadaceae bacterium]|nr:redoxin domain-containing protein [Pyrinomonadaceae bacterium]
MDRRRNLLIGIVLGVIIVGASFSATGYSKRFLRGVRLYPDHKISEYATAPELAPGDWINSEPMRLQDLRGRVVLIDFWTFGCYNCRNTLPFIKGWHDRYRDKGLTVVGVHSPEFDHETKVENLRREVGLLEIHYPVVSDNEFKTWDAYNVAAWPTIFLIDKQGRIRSKHVGEGNYAETERLIQQLLAEKEN